MLEQEQHSEAVETSRLEPTLASFTGTENWHKSNPFIINTDGIEFVAEECKAYWLIDAVGSYQPGLRKSGKHEFQVWTLRKVDKVHKYGCELTMREDTDEPALVKQYIEYTDFPFERFDDDRFEFWVEFDGGMNAPVMLLKSEH